MRTSRVFAAQTVSTVLYGRMESGETYALVERIGENLFSVLPLCCSKNPEKCKAGACSNFKWGNPRTPNKPPRYYKALILKISSRFFFLFCFSPIIR